MFLDGELSSIKRLQVSDNEPIPVRIAGGSANTGDETFR
jgi:hypothetical protein